jgi:hypothetical protein
VLRTICAFRRLSSINFPERAPERYLSGTLLFRVSVAPESSDSNPDEQVFPYSAYPFVLIEAGLGDRQGDRIVRQSVAAGCRGQVWHYSILMQFDAHPIRVVGAERTKNKLIR